MDHLCTENNDRYVKISLRVNKRVNLLFARIRFISKVIIFSHTMQVRLPMDCHMFVICDDLRLIGAFYFP